MLSLARARVPADVVGQAVAKLLLEGPVPRLSGVCMYGLRSKYDPKEGLKVDPMI